MAQSTLPKPSSRGLTLIEILVVVALAAVFMVAVIMGTGALTNARVRSAATMVTSAIRVAFTRATSTSRAHRVVFDIDKSLVLIEETSMPMLVRRDDETRTGGAEASSQQEKDAIRDADRIIGGPAQARPMFKPVRALGFEADDPETGRELGRGVQLKRVLVAHSEEPQTSGRAYLYFWPGGMSERASIQLGRADSNDESDMLSVLVSPLTGKARVEVGAKDMEEMREDGEREDRGY